MQTSLFFRVATAMGSVWLLLLSAPGTAAGLEVGDAAPDFLFQGSDRKQYGRDDLVARGGAVIAWFPRAFTPG